MAGRRETQGQKPVIFSYTKLGILSKCHKYYQYMYIDRLFAPTPFVFAFGIAMHRMLELFYKNNFQSGESFANYFSRYWYDIREDRNKRIGPVKVFDEAARNHIFGYHLGLGKRILRNFYLRDIGKRREYGRRVREELKKARLLSAKAKRRKKFLAGLDDLFPKVESHFEIEFNGRLIRGSIDRIDFHDNGIVFFDYKTDKHRNNPDDLVLLKNPGHQFTIYELALRDLFPQHELTGRYLIHLRSLENGRDANPLVPVRKNAVDLESLAKALDRAQEVIDKREFDRNVGMHCMFCAYYETCSRDVFDEYTKFPDPVFGAPPESEKAIAELESKIEQYWGTDLVESGD